MTEFLESVLASLTSLNEVLQILLIIVGSLISEDLTILSTAALAGVGDINGYVFLIGNFLGIFVGDALLYAMGRGIVRSRKIRSNPTLKSLSRLLNHRPALTFGLILLSRAIPGTRVPINTACGMVKYPLVLFFSATALAVGLWVGLFSYLQGPLSMMMLPEASTVLLVVLCVLVAYWLLKKIGETLILLADPYRRCTVLAGVKKYLYFEFWPAHIFYAPIVPWYIWLSLRYWGFLTPTHANPGIFAGGLIGESKKLIYDSLPDNASYKLAYTVFGVNTKTDSKTATDETLDTAARLKTAKAFMEQHALSYPIIVKPDTGQRGGGVTLVHDDAGLQKALGQPYALVVQEYCPYENELGIFYARHPKKPEGDLLSITVKKFPHVVGDGVSTLGELIIQDKRARLIAGTYLNRFADRLEEIPPKNETIQLVQSGNHAQGSIFENGEHLITPALTAQIDKIAKQVPEFYVGRFDIRYHSQADLENGRHFKLIEINGAGAEATHIYDKNMTLPGAYASLFRQWRVMFQIGAYNRAHNPQSSTTWQFLKKWIGHLRRAGEYPQAS